MAISKSIPLPVTPGRSSASSPYQLSQEVYEQLDPLLKLVADRCLADGRAIIMKGAGQ